MGKKSLKEKRTQTPLANDFKSVALRLECDEDATRFEARLGKIARAKVKRVKTLEKQRRQRPLSFGRKSRTTLR
jgi:hypothetical protein